MTLSQAPMVAAKQLGYFKEEGLDVELMGFMGTGTLIPQMLAKRVDIGYPNPDTLIISRAPGKDKLPLKFFYNATRASGWEFAVLADSPLKSLRTLDGRKVGVGAMTFGNVPITKAEFKELGIDASMVPVGIGSAAFLALQNKQIDALNLFDSQHATLETQGTAIRRLPQLPRYEALFSNGMVAHEDMIRDKPEVLAGFGRAMAKATVVLRDQPRGLRAAVLEGIPQHQAGRRRRQGAGRQRQGVLGALQQDAGVPRKASRASGVSTIRIYLARLRRRPARRRAAWKRSTWTWTASIRMRSWTKFSDFDTAAVQAQAKAFKD